MGLRAFSSFFIIYLSHSKKDLYASSSNPMPTLWPPELKFLPSTSAERVSFTPVEEEKEGSHLDRTGTQKKRITA